MTPFIFMMPPPQLDRCHHPQHATPGRVTRRANFGDFAPLAHSASLARASPVTSSRITIVAGDIVRVRLAAHRLGSDRPVPVSTPIVVAPLNLSLTTMTVQQFHRSADSLRTGQVLARLVALVAGINASRSRSPGAGFARHRLPHHAIFRCPRHCGRP